MKRLFSALTLLSLVVACTDPVDKAAKARIFSPEDPPKVVASASEALAATRAADDAHVAERILSMGAAETTERLGPHRLDATVTTEWTTTGADPVKLVETRTLESGPGGVNGDFHALTSNSRDQGLEVIRAKGLVYARSKYGKFRARLRDRGMAEREREEVFGALPEIAALFDGRVRLVSAGETTIEGRDAVRYLVQLGPKREKGPSELPLLFQPKGLDETTQTRQAFEHHREPAALTGDLWVDAKTAVVLKAKIDGRIEVPSTMGHPAATLKVGLDEAISKIDHDPLIEAPKDFLPDEDKPHGIADALDRFGIKSAADRADENAPDTEPDAP